MKHSMVVYTGNFKDTTKILSAALQACWDCKLSVINSRISSNSIPYIIFKKILPKSIFRLVEHKFYPQGYTCVILLGESHFTIHTYPESNSAYADCFTCGDVEPEEVLLKFAEIFECNHSKIQTSKRS